MSGPALRSRGRRPDQASLLAKGRADLRAAQHSGGQQSWLRAPKPINPLPYSSSSNKKLLLFFAKKRPPNQKSYQMKT